VSWDRIFSINKLIKLLAQLLETDTLDLVQVKYLKPGVSVIVADRRDGRTYCLQAHEMPLHKVQDAVEG
jgi:hypothetical protein